MPQLRIIVVAWLLTGLGTVLGSILGNAFGPRGLFLGAIAGGTLALLLAIRVLTAKGWLVFERRRGGSIGGIVGFAIAAPIAANNLHTPWIPILVTVLVGIGVVAGSGGGATR